MRVTHARAGKKRRLTLIECGNDINSMIDVAKVADLVSPLMIAESMSDSPLPDSAGAAACGCKLWL